MTDVTAFDGLTGVSKMAGQAAGRPTPLTVAPSVVTLLPTAHSLLP